MNKKISIAASALLAPFALAAIVLISQGSDTPQTPTANPSEVYTWDCEIPAQKPEAITFTCADGNMYVDRIDWSHWDAQSAEGTGYFNANTCEPNCAEGEFVNAKVKINLSQPTEYQGKTFLRTLVIRSISGENLPNLSQNFYEWDVMEFAEMMGSL
jgi:hypothetical protein